MRRISPWAVRRWVRDTKFFLDRNLALTALAPSVPDRVWIVLIALIGTVKHLVPGVRRLAVPVRIEDIGVIWVTDRSEMATIGEVYLNRSYETSFLPVAPRTIVDLGANIGLASRYFHSRFPAATIFAFEADPAVCRTARRNLRLTSGVVLRNLAVSDRTGALTFGRLPGQSWGTSRYVTSADSFCVEAVTLDAIIDELGWVDILKMDVEGGEHDILRACRSLNRVGLIIGEFHAVPGVTAADFRDALSEFDIVDDQFGGGKGSFVARRRAVRSSGSAAPS